MFELFLSWFHNSRGQLFDKEIDYLRVLAKPCDINCRIVLRADNNLSFIFHQMPTSINVSVEGGPVQSCHLDRFDLKVYVNTSLYQQFHTVETILPPLQYLLLVSEG